MKNRCHFSFFLVWKDKSDLAICFVLVSDINVNIMIYCAPEMLEVIWAVSLILVAACHPGVGMSPTQPSISEGLNDRTTAIAFQCVQFW